MKKFNVTGLLHASVYLGEFEAETKEEAIEKALNSDKNHASICHRCSENFELDDCTAHEAIAEEVE